VLELSNYFQKLILINKLPPPRRFRPGPEAPSLLHHWSYSWYISSHWENLLYLE